MYKAALRNVWGNAIEFHITMYCFEIHREFHLGTTFHEQYSLTLGGNQILKFFESKRSQRQSKEKEKKKEEKN